MSKALDIRIIQAASELYRCAELLQVEQLNEKLSKLVINIITQVRTILAECTVYSLLFEDEKMVDEAVSRFIHTTRNPEAVIRTSIYIISHLQEEHPLTETQAKYVQLLEKHHREMAEAIAAWYKVVRG